MAKRRNKYILFSIILIFLIIIGLVVAAGNSNIQSHPINQIDGFSLSGTNITLNSSYNFNVSGILYYGTLDNEGNLNVNRSNFWDNFNIPTDLNYRLLSYWVNITNRPTHLGNFTDNILWTVGFNASFDSRDSDTTYTASGVLLNLAGTTFSVNNGTLTNSKGCKYVTGTGIVCDQTYLTSYTEIDPFWTANQSSYYNITDILGFDYYNSSDFVITDYYTRTQINNFGYYNITNFDINNYYLKSNPFSFYNSSTLVEHDPKWTGNKTNVAFTNIEETFTGNITVEGVKFEIDSTNHRIYDNATCIIIKGDTSTLNIC